MGGHDVEYDSAYAGYLTSAGIAQPSDPVGLRGLLKAMCTAIGNGTTPSPQVTTPSIANSATGVQVSTTNDVMLYLQVGTAGTAMVIKIGPTSSPANTVHASGAAVSGDLYTIRVPAGWYVSTTYTTATIANQLAVTC